MSSDEHSEGRYKQLRDYYEDTKLQVTVETVQSLQRTGKVVIALR